MTMIQARDYVPKAFPTTAGKAFAEALLGLHEPLGDVQVDLDGVPNGMITSPFFNGVLQTIFDRQPNLLPDARKIEWLVAHEFQRELIDAWVRDFVPYDVPAQ